MVRHSGCQLADEVSRGWGGGVRTFWKNQSRDVSAAECGHRDDRHLGVCVGVMNAVNEMWDNPIIVGVILN
jgi:hypothetical protein